MNRKQFGMFFMTSVWILLLLTPLAAATAKKNVKSPNNLQSAVPTKTSEPDPALKAKIMESYGKIPLYFTQNTGQMDKQVIYYASGPGGMLYFTQEGIVSRIIKRESKAGSKEKTKKSIAPEKTASVDTTPVVEHHVVLKKLFQGMNPNCQLMGQDQLPGRVNIFRGNDTTKWQQNIPTFKMVVYKDIYPGVDLRYFGTQGNLEYDLMIAPQKKVPPLVFKVDGADKVEITPDGDLAIYTSLGIFLEKKPQAGQTKEGKKQLIPCSYKITSGNSITINLSKYDLSLPLVIQ